MGTNRLGDKNMDGDAVRERCERTRRFVEQMDAFHGRLVNEEVRLTIPLDHDMEIRNRESGETGIVPASLLRIASRNGYTTDEVMDYLETYQSPQLVIDHFRVYEIVQHMKLLRHSQKNNIDALALLQSSRTRKRNLKLWMLGEDTCGVGEAILGLLRKLEVSVKEVHGFTCDPEKYFVMSIGLRQKTVYEEYGSLENFAGELKRKGIESGGFGLLKQPYRATIVVQREDNDLLLVRDCPESVRSGREDTVRVEVRRKYPERWRPRGWELAS